MGRWNPSEQEVSSVASLTAAKRYGYFVKRVADNELVWSLWRDGWALAGDDKGTESVPVWPHECYAALCASDAWDGYVPKVIDLCDWLQKWCPGIKKDGRLVAVFPTPKDKGVFVDAARLETDLREELANYE